MREWESLTLPVRRAREAIDEIAEADTAAFTTPLFLFASSNNCDEDPIDNTTLLLPFVEVLVVAVGLVADEVAE